MPCVPFFPYAAAAGHVIRRLPPTRMPWTPMSHPLITSPLPRWKLKGLPDDWSKIFPVGVFNRPTEVVVGWGWGGVGEGGECAMRGR